MEYGATRDAAIAREWGGRGEGGREGRRGGGGGEEGAREERGSRGGGGDDGDGRKRERGGRGRGRGTDGTPAEKGWEAREGRGRGGERGFPCCRNGSRGGGRVGSKGHRVCPTGTVRYLPTRVVCNARYCTRGVWPYHAVPKLRAYAFLSSGRMVIPRRAVARGTERGRMPTARGTALAACELGTRY
eukprot:813010-Rhodomonas_salina.5